VSRSRKRNFKEEDIEATRSKGEHEWEKRVKEHVKHVKKLAYVKAKKGKG
jgi:hypothetical protein